LPRRDRADPALQFPRCTGVHFDSARDNWQKFEVHYENPNGESGTDSSGFRLTLIDAKMAPTYQRIGIFRQGQQEAKILIPPGLETFVLANACTPRLQPSGINVFAFKLHAHGMAKAGWTSVHNSSGAFLAHACCTTTYVHTWTMLPEVVHVPAKSTFVATMVYNSSRMTQAMPGGMGGDKEMLFINLLYYPRDPKLGDWDCYMQSKPKVLPPRELTVREQTQCGYRTSDGPEGSPPSFAPWRNGK
jgi:hypothetical protein